MSDVKRDTQCRGPEQDAVDRGDQDGIYFDGEDAEQGREILWETKTPDGREFEIAAGQATVVLPLSWTEIDRLHEALGDLRKERP